MPALLQLLLLSAAMAAARPEEPVPVYTDINSVQALRNLEKITGRNPKGMAESELSAWVRARMARIALLRLEGRVEEALSVFGECGRYCEMHGPTEEWRALKSWGCGKRAKAAPCVKGK